MFNTDAVKDRLKSLGYEVKADDEFALTFCVEKVRSTIKNAEKPQLGNNC